MEDHYIAGFVDGEGSFHVAFQRSDDVRIGWQAVPEFHVSQNDASRGVLEAIRRRLGCGYVKSNHAKNERDKTFVLVVRNRQDLHEKVIPFFERYRLHTEKRMDFEKFSVIVRMMMKDGHLSKEGFSKIVRLAYSMNAQGRYRKVRMENILDSLKSSETLRSVPAGKSWRVKT
jgi:LAGLIDADG endonuclease